MPQLSILMPAFNEEATIAEAIERVLTADLPVDGLELIVVENGSTDSTREQLEAGRWPDSVRVLTLDANAGKGGAIRHALEQARGEYVAILDADLEYDAADLAALLEPILAGRAEAAIGTRVFQAHSAYGFWYVVGGRGITVAANMLYDAWLSDILNCLKVMPTDLMRSLRLRSNGFEIDAEIPARLLRSGVRIYEVPVTYAARSRRQGKKLSSRDGIRILGTLLRCRFDSWSPASRERAAESGSAACPACGGQGSRPAFEVRGHSFRRCRACSSLYLEAPPDQAELDALYEGERYFANPDYAASDYFGYRDYLSDRDHIERKFDEVLQELERFTGPGRLLDVGAGPGLLLAAARRRGWEARGLELNSWARDYGRDELGVEIGAGSLEEAELEPASFDAVTMMDVIEHVADPDALLAAAARVVRPGGVLAVLTPNAGSPFTRALGRRWPEVQRAGEHAVLFSVEGLESLLGRHSFEPLSWHSVGKRSSVDTLLADLAPIAPGAERGLRRVLGGGISSRTVELDPRAKFCLYARRLPA
jgi:SAM-dependent methyltransferase